MAVTLYGGFRVTDAADGAVTPSLVDGDFTKACVRLDTGASNGTVTVTEVSGGDYRYAVTLSADVSSMVSISYATKFVAGRVNGIQDVWTSEVIANIAAIKAVTPATTIAAASDIPAVLTASDVENAVWDSAAASHVAAGSTGLALFSVSSAAWIMPAFPYATRDKADRADGSTVSVSWTLISAAGGIIPGASFGGTPLVMVIRLRGGAETQIDAENGGAGTGECTPTYDQNIGYLQCDIKYLEADWENGDVLVALVHGIEVSGVAVPASVNVIVWQSLDNTALATASNLTTVDGIVDAIKLKTDLIPAAPAAVGSNMGTVSGVTGDVAGKVLGGGASTITGIGASVNFSGFTIGAGTYAETLIVNDGTNPLSGARVQVRNSDGTVVKFEALTDDDGKVAFNSEAGTYRVYVSKGGYGTASAYYSRTVSADGALTAISMTSASGTSPVNPSLCAVYLTLLNAGAQDTDATITLTPADLPQGAGSVSSNIQTQMFSSGSVLLVHQGGGVYRGEVYKGNSTQAARYRIDCSDAGLLKSNDPVEIGASDAYDIAWNTSTGIVTVKAR